MKTLIFSVALLWVLNLKAQQPLAAGVLIDSAYTRAVKEKKNIFVMFTATWCGPCKELKRTLTDIYNKQYFEDNYVIIILYGDELERNKQIENTGTDSVRKSLRPDSLNFLPYWAVITPKRKKLAEGIGFSLNPEDLKIFLKTIKRTSHLRDNELEMIYSRCQQLNKLTREED